MAPYILDCSLSLTYCHRFSPWMSRMTLFYSVWWVFIMHFVDCVPRVLPLSVSPQCFNVLHSPLLHPWPPQRCDISIGRMESFLQLSVHIWNGPIHNKDINSNCNNKYIFKGPSLIIGEDPFNLQFAVGAVIERSNKLTDYPGHISYILSVPGF